MARPAELQSPASEHLSTSDLIAHLPIRLVALSKADLCAHDLSIFLLEVRRPTGLPLSLDLIFLADPMGADMWSHTPPTALLDRSRMLDLLHELVWNQTVPIADYRWVQVFSIVVRRGNVCPS